MLVSTLVPVACVHGTVYMVLKRAIIKGLKHLPGNTAQNNNENINFYF